MSCQIIAASDHAGFELKKFLADQASQKGWSFLDLGTFDSSPIDYPDLVHRLADALRQREDAWGLLICGSGNGVCITANRYPHIRAAIAWQPELARLARAHNDANVLCLPARFIDPQTALECLNQFVTTSFEGGRHAVRVSKINP